MTYQENFTIPTEILEAITVPAGPAGLAPETLPDTQVTDFHSEEAGQDYRIFVSLPQVYGTDAAKTKKYGVGFTHCVPLFP